jgi:hypothetical protein
LLLPWQDDSWPLFPLLVLSCSKHRHMYYLMCTYVHTFTCMSAHVRACIFVCLSVCLAVCMNEWKCVCVCVCVCVCTLCLFLAASS